MLKPHFLVCHADMRESAAIFDFERIRQLREATAAKIVLEVVVPDEDASEVIETILTAARTGELGDGRIFVTDLENVIRIRTGEAENAYV